MISTWDVRKWTQIKAVSTPPRRRCPNVSADGAPSICVHLRTSTVAKFLRNRKRATSLNSTRIEREPAGQNDREHAARPATPAWRTTRAASRLPPGAVKVALKKGRAWLPGCRKCWRIATNGAATVTSRQRLLRDDGQHRRKATPATRRIRPLKTRPCPLKSPGPLNAAATRRLPRRCASRVRPPGADRTAPG